MWIRDWKLRWVAVIGAVVAAFAIILKVAGAIGDVQTLADIIRAIPKYAVSWWFIPFLNIIGLLFILYAVYGDSRKRKAAASASLSYLSNDAVQVTRSSNGGYERGAGDDKAIVLWFDNTTSFDYSNVRAWLRYKTPDNKEDEFEECDGLWLGEYRRIVCFKSKDRKALVIAIRDRNDKFFLVTNPRECDGATGCLN
jgi:hypothetical protein